MVSAQSVKPVKKAATAEPVEIFSMNDRFLSELGSLELMKRDRFIAEKLNTIIEATGTVLTFEEHPQFRKKFRIVVTSGAGKSVTIIYNIYTENGDYAALLPEGQKFNFRGQYVMVTPVNSKRDLYIIDVILQDGAAVVE
jgi:hypothetical protein